MKQFVLIAVLFSSLAFADEPKHLETSPHVDRWGFDIGLGQQPYMLQVTKLALLTPQLFGQKELGEGWRLALEATGRRLQAFEDDGIWELALSFEHNSRIYKDIAYTYARLGLGVMDMGDLYDGTIVTAPIAIGLHVITHNTDRSVMSFFVEYKWNYALNYDHVKSLPGDPLAIDEDALFAGATNVGLRLLF